MLKADLHIHTREDPHDPLEWTAVQAIDLAKKQGFDVIAITLHEGVLLRTTYSYAKKQGILLIPGTEMVIEGKHVLCYNFGKKILKIKTFKQLSLLKNKNNLVIAPHPFYPFKHSLREKFWQNKKAFDAVEHARVYLKWLNPNKKAYQTKMPLVGNSDAHAPFMLGQTYSLIESEKTTADVIAAIKKGRVKPVTKPLTLLEFAKNFIFFMNPFRF